MVKLKEAKLKMVKILRPRRMKDAVSRMKIRTKLLLLILLSGIFCILLFGFLWQQKWNVWWVLANDFPVRLDIFPKPGYEDFYDKLVKEAADHTLPESDTDEGAVRALEPLLDLANEYTSIYIYGWEDGMFRTGRPPAVMENSLFRAFFQFDQEWTNGTGEQISFFQLRFKNGYGSVVTASYHRTCFIFLYFLFCLIVCILLFLSVILFFVGKKMKVVVRLEEEILRMASGDLVTPVLCTGQDGWAGRCVWRRKTVFSWWNCGFH